MKVTVMQHERVVRYFDGRFVAVLEPGRHTFWRRWRWHHVRVDLRERQSVVPSQELLTSDGVSLKVSSVARWRVTDPVAFVERVESPQDTLYTAVQLVLREAISSRTADAVVADRIAISAELVDRVGVQAERFGVDVVEVAVRDVVLPGDLRRVFAEVTIARQQGLAAIERARAETAALRALANGAQVLEQHPLLAGLRAVQVAADAGATVVLDRPQRSTG